MKRRTTEKERRSGRGLASPTDKAKSPAADNQRSNSKERGLARPRWPLAVVAVLASAFFAQSFSASLKKSATFDEPIHIAAGLSYVETGRIVVSTDHPPLLKELSALSVRQAGVHWPTTPQANALMNGELQFSSSVARSIILENGPDRVLFWARLPLILVATGLVLVVYMLGRRLVGEAAAIGAAFLSAFDPNILAHSFLVTTDVGLATFLLLFVVALWEFVTRFGMIRAIVCGVALGAALGAKYSAVVLPVLAVLMMLAAARWPREDADSGSHRRTADERAPVRSGAVSRLLKYGVGLCVMGVVAFVVLQLIYLFPKDPFQYLSGWGNIYGARVEGFQGYMAGHLAPRFYSYYIVAFLLKEPVATILLAAVGLWIVVRNKSMPVLTRAFLLLPPALFVAGYSVMSFDIGIRYLMPALPFAHLLGGVALAGLLQSARAPARAVGAALCTWVVVAAAGIYPDHLSYFNEAACVLEDPKKLGFDGGSRCGPAWLDDSNVDWGQGLKQLKSWLDENAPGRPIRLGYFGTIPPDAYGLRQTPMTDEDLLYGRTQGLYAVSAHIVASTPAVAKRARGGGAEWLRTTRPVAIVGHAFYIFDVPANPQVP